MWIKKVTDIPVDLIVTNPGSAKKMFLAKKSFLN